jgi:hypothetical protein
MLLLSAGPAFAGEISVAGKSEAGLYAYTAAPAEKTASVGPIHVWRVTLADASGKPVTAAKIMVEGGMPGHGHGLPTAPEMTGEAEPGVYLVDGVKFSMTGEWELRFVIDATPGKDIAVAKFSIE